MNASRKIYVNHLASEVKRRFASQLDLSDVKGASETQRDAALKTRGLAAFALQCCVPDLDDSEAAAHVTDGTGDNGIDALYVDESDRRIYVVQSKWHDNGTASIGLGDMRNTIAGLRDITEEKYDRFNNKFEKIFPKVENVLSDPAVTFTLVIASSGSSTLSSDVQAAVDDTLNEMNEISQMLSVKLLGLGELHEILRVGGVAAKISLSVSLEGWGVVTEPYTAYYGVVSGAAVAEWYLEHGGRLFDDNLRKALGRTSVNDGLLETIEQSPENFWYFNNGITVLCDTVQKTGKGGGSRVAGDFSLNGVSIVNGAQTVSSLAEMARRAPSDELLDSVRVWIRIISLDGCPEGFSSDVTRATNTQNVVENRDFIALDPRQQRIQDDMRIMLNKQYVFKRGDKTPDAEDGCTVSDAIVALACAHRDSMFAVLAKSAVGRLEETRGRYYPQMFNSETTAFSVWSMVRIYRTVESVLAELRKTASGKKKAIATQGNRVITHLVMQKVQSSRNLYESVSDEAMEQLLDGVSREVEVQLDALLINVERYYAGNYVTSLFKNAAKCAHLVSRIRASELQNS